MKNLLCIFDLDGTLVDTTEDIANSVNIVLQNLGLNPLTTAQIAQFIGKGAGWLLQKSLQAAGDSEAQLLPKAREIFLKVYSENLTNRTYLYPGTTQLLQYLREAGDTLALCTNKPQTLSEKLLEHFGLIDYFSIIVGGDTLPKRKPDPDPLLYIVEKLQKNPQQTLMIGDSDYDVEAGLRAGTWTVLVEQKSESPKGKFKPHFRCQTIGDCIGIIDSVRAMNPFQK